MHLYNEICGTLVIWVKKVRRDLIKGESRCTKSNRGSLDAEFASVSVALNLRILDWSHCTGSLMHCSNSC